MHTNISELNETKAWEATKSMDDKKRKIQQN